MNYETNKEFIDFYRGWEEYNNYSIKSIFEMTKKELKENYDYIQLLFPYNKENKHFPNAPILSKQDINIIKMDKYCQQTLTQSFNFMMIYFGFKRIEFRLIFTKERYRWLDNNFDFIRITRILESLRLLGRYDECFMFFVALSIINKIKENAEKIGNNFEYWVKAYNPGIYEYYKSKSNYQLSAKHFTDFKLLLRGLIGDLFTAIHKYKQKPVIIKLLDTNHPNYHKRSAEREIFISNYLFHPNIIEFIGYFVHANYICLVFEYLKNGSLTNYLKILGPHDLSHHKSIIIDIINGLRYMLSMGIVHRDVKCENILIDSNSRAKITDFGLGISIYSSEKLCESRVGTLHYMAPEMLDDEGIECDYKIDIWSVGVVIYVMYFGYYPFDSNAQIYEDAREIIKRKISTLDYTIPKILKNGDITPQSLVNIIQSIFVLDPALRPSYEILERLVGYF